MKGSMGVSSAVSTGVGRASVGTGLRTSGGAIASKSFGSSFSPEARIGGASSKFSSRSLSMFNREAISRPSHSVINANRGKEAKSSFARTPSLSKNRNIIDVNRPARSNFVEKHTSKSEFGVKLNSKNGTEVRSNKARSINLAPQKSMFNVGRKTSFEFGKRMNVGQREMIRSTVFSRVDAPKREAYRTVAKRTIEVGSNPKVRSERVKSISPFKDTVILWQRKDVVPRVKLESAARTVRLFESVRQVRKERVQQVRRKIETNSRRRLEAQSIFGKKTEKVKAPRRLKIGNAIRISPNISPEMQALMRQDIKEAKVVLIPTIMKGRKISYTEAVKEAAQVLEKKHTGKLQVKYEAFAMMQHVLDEQSKDEEAVSSTKAQNKDAQNKTKKKDMGKLPPAPNVKENLLYFKKDLVANEQRQNRFINAFHKLLKNKREGDADITGYDIIKEAGEAPLPQELSELTRPQGVDYRYHKFVYAVKFMGSMVTDPKSFLTLLGVAIYRYSAIKLSTKEDADAKGMDAMEVYGKSLDWVDANIEELEWKKWKLKAYGNSKKVHLAKNQTTLK